MEAAISPHPEPEPEPDSAESDHDLAFRLQLEEAIAASLSFNLPHLHDTDPVLNVGGSPQRTQDSGFDLHPEKNGERASSDTFVVYFKSYTGDADAPVVWGIGVAICDYNDNLIFDLGKTTPGSGRNRLEADCRALIEALNAALSLNLAWVQVYLDSFSLFQYLRRRWRPKQCKVRALVDQVSLLRNKFASVSLVHVARKDIKHVFKLAREAVDHLRPESSSNFTLRIYCVICSDSKPSTQMFHIDSCSHRYCFSCMKQHVEAKLLHGILPKCPHENCTSQLMIESCNVFLSPKLIEMFGHQMKEASIPAFEKVYCPYPKCSTLMSKKDIITNDENGARQCIKCEKKFCINCKVPWHDNLDCSEYKELNHHHLSEEVKLKNLAEVNRWRQCKMCSNLIELAAGCHHITCRCGYQFCYSCGAEWKNKMATCSCPLWIVENIMYEEEENNIYEEEFMNEGDNEFMGEDDNEFMGEDDDYEYDYDAHLYFEGNI